MIEMLRAAWIQVCVLRCKCHRHGSQRARAIENLHGAMYSLLLQHYTKEPMYRAQAAHIPMAHLTISCVQKRASADTIIARLHGKLNFGVRAWCSFGAADLRVVHDEIIQALMLGDV